jgi:hypothetical protein
MLLAAGKAPDEHDQRLASSTDKPVETNAVTGKDSADVDVRHLSRTCRESLNATRDRPNDVVGSAITRLPMSSVARGNDATLDALIKRADLERCCVEWP